MKKSKISIVIITGLVFITLLSVNSCRTSSSGKGNTEGQVEEIMLNPNGQGSAIQVSFTKGKAFNNPTFVIWMEDSTGRFLQTLYVTRSFGSGTFTYGDASGGEWKPGQVKRPASLPYWSHKAGAVQGMTAYIPDAGRPMPDAVSSATPKGNFLLLTKGEKQYKGVVKIMLEINQN